MKIHENPFKLIKYGRARSARPYLINFNGFSCIFMDSHGFSWILIDFHGFSWIFIDFHGFSWILGGGRILIIRPDPANTPVPRPHSYIQLAAGCRKQDTRYCMQDTRTHRIQGCKDTRMHRIRRCKDDLLCFAAWWPL